MKTKIFIAALGLMINLGAQAQSTRAKLEVIENNYVATGAGGGAIEATQYTYGIGNAIISKGMSGTLPLSTTKINGYGAIDATNRDFGLWANVNGYNGNPGTAVGLAATYQENDAGDISNSAYLAGSDYAARFKGTVDILSGPNTLGSVLNFKNNDGTITGSITTGLGSLLINNMQGPGTGTLYNVALQTTGGLFTLKDNGNAQLGSGSYGAYKLTVSGTGTAAKTDGSSVWTVVSDSRLKENIENYSDGLELIKKIRPYRYNYTGEYGLPSSKKIVGVLAQDLQKIAPYMVEETELSETNDKGEIIKSGKFLSINIDALRYAMVNAIQEQQAMIEDLQEDKSDLKNEVERLSRENESLEARLTALENLLSKELPCLQSNSNKTTPSLHVEMIEESRLEQNVPNPFYHSTRISYFVPENAQNAALQVVTLDGKVAKNINITNKGTGTVNISGNELAAGTYVYTLYVNGEKVAAKEMILTK
ncbi:MAG: tail fiber domain-containing protein [Sphingobacteriales bacterium]|nr:tail fiber domain-containing protein [Sphingobacteriales bacterium]